MSPARLPLLSVALLAAVVLAGSGWLLSAPSPVTAQDRAEPVATVTAVDPMQEVTPEREAAAETFARLHHPELAALLLRLKAGGESAYDNAVRDLFRESERLAKLKGRDPERYAIELELWKSGSRIQLAAARLAMEDSAALKAELLTLLQTKLAIRTQLLQLDRDKTALKLDRLDADLAELQADPVAQATVELEKLLKAARPRAAQAKQEPAAASRPKPVAPVASPERGRSGSGDPQSPGPSAAPPAAAADSAQ